MVFSEYKHHDIKVDKNKQEKHRKLIEIINLMRTGRPYRKKDLSFRKDEQYRKNLLKFLMEAWKLIPMKIDFIDYKKIDIYSNTNLQEIINLFASCFHRFMRFNKVIASDTDNVYMVVFTVSGKSKN